MGPDTTFTADRPHNTAPRDSAREQRHELIARRHAAQSEWRRTELLLGQARRNLTEALGGTFLQNVPVFRKRLAQAQSDEREARSSYHDVAHETGGLLSRMHRTSAR